MALRRAFYRCEQCGARHPLEFHHKRRLDNSLFACVVLCVPCHLGLHQRQRERQGQAPRFNQGETRRGIF
jgi:hypothetical protein